MYHGILHKEMASVWNGYIGESWEWIFEETVDHIDHIQMAFLRNEW